jgi:phosphate transport system substrate-binding protein
VDIPLTNEQLDALNLGRTVLHVPTALGAVVLAYNVPGVGVLQLDASTAGGIFLGTILSWNDPQIAALNQGVALPDVPIAVVHRADSAGSTAAATSYLDAGSPAWRSSVGTGATVTWPTGSAAIGDDGVARAVSETRGAVGYTTLSAAAKAGLAAAALKNPAGQFVTASPTSIAASGDATAAGFPADFRSDPLVNAQGVHSYPIVAYAYLLIDKDQPDSATAQALISLITWSLTNGQADDGPNGYAPLPGVIQQKVLAALHTVTSGGTPVWP